jgi:hypothetical protein
LILGHDLTDEAVMDRIWPIITNREALKISQSFGTGDHPGGLVKTWVPPSTPSAPPNRTQQWPWALNDDLATSSGWTVSVAGVAGPVRHRSPVSPHTSTDLCLTVPVVGRDKGTVLLSGCTDPVAPNQTWVHDMNGNLHIQTTTQSQAPCLVLAGATGPIVELFRCKPGGNEVWNYSRGNGTLCSRTIAHTGTPQTKCLSARNSPATGDSGDGTMQLWAKPQPGGAVALFVLNNLPAGSDNISSIVPLANLNYTHTGPSEVFDVWAGAALPPLPAGTTTVPTSAINSYDSTFLLITPQA